MPAGVAYRSSRCQSGGGCLWQGWQLQGSGVCGRKEWWGTQNLEDPGSKGEQVDFVYLLEGLRRVGTQEDLASKHWKLGGEKFKERSGLYHFIKEIRSQNFALFCKSPGRASSPCREPPSFSGPLRRNKRSSVGLSYPSSVFSIALTQTTPTPPCKQQNGVPRTHEQGKGMTSRESRPLRPPRPKRFFIPDSVDDAAGGQPRIHFN